MGEPLRRCAREPLICYSAYNDYIARLYRIVSSLAKLKRAPALSLPAWPEHLASSAPPALAGVATLTCPPRNAFFERRDCAFRRSFRLVSGVQIPREVGAIPSTVSYFLPQPPDVFV